MPKKEDMPADDFHAEMKEAHVEALWEIWKDRYDTTPEKPFCWTWKDIEPLMHRAVGEVMEEDGPERRVLCLRNPASRDESAGASPNLYANIQALVPGEIAPAHRHSMGALRFVLRGGATTVVDGKSCPMGMGDLVLTPAWTWHSHHHDGSDLAIWVDFLDAPIHRHFGTGVIEPGPAKDIPDRLPDSAYHAPGLTPELHNRNSGHSPMFRYPWAKVNEALNATPPSRDGSRLLRYTDPASGGSVMTLMDCFVLALNEGQATIACRSTSNAIAVVVEGTGTTRVGDETVGWSKHDVFSLPHGNWISHRSADTDAKLFMVSDRELLRRLDLLKDETET